MPNRLVFALLIAATLYASAASVISLSSPEASRSAFAPAAPIEAIGSIPTLPTVVVRADAPPTLLPTVTVRASREEIAAAFAGKGDPDTREASVVHGYGGVLLASPSFDMPYYSFGKSMYRVSKE